MAKIQSIQALEILDSRGNPTIEVIIHSDSGRSASAKVPSGASTGEHEALELRDNDKKRYMGKGVLKAVENVQKIIQPKLLGFEIDDQRKLDETLLSLDGSANKKHLGANSILGVSLAFARLVAIESNTPLYQSILGNTPTLLPCPMMNIINGGAHADNGLNFQEFMIRPLGAPTFREALRYGDEVFHQLKKILKERKLTTSVGDEGGFAPNLESNEEALECIIQAIDQAGYRPGLDITIALDPAASEFYDKDSQRYIDMKKKEAGEKFDTRTSEDQVSYLQQLAKKYPIDSIEDGLDQNDWTGWKNLTEKLGDKLQIVGDDLFVTNQEYLQKGIDEKIANSILIKLNQIGTLTETLDTIALAQKNNYTTVISHRSGETADTFIADLSVATSSGQIKTGSLSRSDRVAKYNRLLEIEAELGQRAQYAKK